MDGVMVLREKNGKRKKWSRSWLQRRQQGLGVLSMLDKELIVEDSLAYRNFLRMTNPQFEYLLAAVEIDIKKQDTFMRDAISARNK
ncbi:hypothetical protein NQ314_009050 [Rhamnusium bicolor]|uniref:Uncharacterized protein n=1 Tax=Rhamnusium bicolor TaxID=1586634 RepID=A0AAV8Y2T5_9CUCU|nr:hypothetical protein NQ314_009050 [Rhamnusium bicolor]